MLILRKPSSALIPPYDKVLDDFRHVYFLKLFKRDPHNKITVLIVFNMTYMRIWTIGFPWQMLLSKVPSIYQQSEFILFAVVAMI